MYANGTKRPLYMLKIKKTKKMELFMKNFVNTLKVLISFAIISIIFTNCPDPIINFPEVDPPGIIVSSVDLNYSMLSLSMRDRVTLSAIILPADATDKTTTWFSSDTSIVSVTDEGRITAHKPGAATITVTTNNGQKKAYCEVNVYNRVDNLNVDRLKAVLNGDTGKILYSYSYNEFNYYYIYLGRMENIPLFSPDNAAINFNGGSPQWFEYTKEVIEKINIENTISTSITETIGYIESNVIATETGNKTSWTNYWEAGGSGGLDLGIFKIGGGGKYTETRSGEDSWNNYTSKSTTDSFEQVRSVANTLTHASEYTNKTVVSRGFSLSSDDRPGRYRLTMFAVSDVYLYVIKDSITGDIYYEFTEHVVPGEYDWLIEYAEPGHSFRRSASGFEIDISILKNLPKPKLVFNPYDLSFTPINGNTAYSVSRGNATDANIRIPHVYNGLPVTAISNGGFTDYKNLASIMIPNSVTSIGYGAFAGCTSLTSINIPSSVTSIGYSTFESCISLTSINIPSNVTSIGYSAFESCISLTSINIPSSVTSIGERAFSLCRSLTSINIPSSVTSIGQGAFISCSSLTSINIPSSVTSIGNSAFADCTSLTKVFYGGANNSVWSAIIFGSWNSSLTSATRYYYSETNPGSGNYWRYVGGVPTAW